MKFLPVYAILFLTASAFAADAEPAKVFPSGEKCSDSRLGKPKDYNGYFPFTPPVTKEGWNERSKKVREQMLVGLGLWPMPEKTPLNPVIHGKIQMDGYTIEKVYFSSMPGHYVSGNLYRPTGKVEGKRPAVLNPHGHWPSEGPNGGRFHDAGDAKVKKELADGAEKTPESARFPLQAKCVGLVRMGIVVFHYDMVGYADSQPFKHRTGFTDAEAELRSQNFMGLQTWNSIRALDFLASLPDVDPEKIAVTGASGGGTQTFILCAIDPRPAVAFPAVMVSTAMQGGCACENCSYLRVGTGNVEIAGLFAPKPLAMSAAKDWTIDIETKGLPELKKLYKLYDAENLVAARTWPQFGHNYNQVAREFMYNWFNEHLLKQKNVVAESSFKPVPTKELSVYDDKHPRPKDELDAAGLRKVMTEAAEKQLKALEPKDMKSLTEFRHVVGTALNVMVNDALPRAEDVEVKKIHSEIKLASGEIVHRSVVSRKGANEAMPIVTVIGADFNGTVVLWLHPKGKASLFAKGELVPAAKAILARKAAILAPDLFQTGELMGEKPFPVDTKYAGFTYGYNRSVFAQRVHDILTAIRFAKSHPNCKTLHLVGWEQVGVWAAAARALAGDNVARTSLDLNQFRFENIKSVDDEEMLPGIVKFGGVPALVALCAPHDLLVHNHKGTHTGELSKAAYDAAGAKDRIKRSPEKLKDAEVIEWLLGK
ncbi:MAG: hypothetical protein K8T89_13275 [Planctomycetes bacterium]|nr:hypothetical protein [Planctomycetota bacterium]